MCCILVKMSGRKKSSVWTFYTETDDQNKVKCVVCGSLISRGGSGRKASTSALTNHIRVKHDRQFAQLQHPVHSQNPILPSVGASTSKTEEVPVPMESSLRQASIESSFESKWKIDDPRSKQIHRAIAEMIAVDNQPTSVVDDAGFNRLMAVLKPKYQIPSRKYITETVLVEIYDQLKKMIYDQLTAAKTITITSDMWTCINNMLCFLSFTAHWLDNNFVLQHRVLQMKSFSDQHTARNIQCVLEEIAESWNISNKIHVIITDNGRNIVKAVNDSPFVGKTCFIHTLQLAIHGALEAQKSVNEAIVAGRRIVTHFNHSKPAQEKLQLIQTELNAPKHKLIQDVSTRWNSTYYMAERLLEQKRAISLYISDNSGTINFQNLSERQWDLLKECLTLLQPFEEITKKISSSYSCISEVIPGFTILARYLVKDEVQAACPNVNIMRVSLTAELNRRFSGIEDDRYYNLATLLDPRYKMNFFAQSNVPMIRRNFLAEFVRRSEDFENSSSDEEVTHPLQSPSSANNDIHRTFWNCYEELAAVKLPNVEETKSPIAFELDRYLADDLLPKNQCPYGWWAKNKEKFPNMSYLARIFLSSPGSSVYSERLFSEAGNVYEQKRNRLLPERAESLVFLHHNLPLVNFKYE